MVQRATDETLAGRWKKTREIDASLGLATWEAVHVVTRRRGALVVPAAAGSGHASARRRILRETEALARVQHPCVVDVYDAGTASGSPFLVRELVEGRTIESLLVTRGRLSIELVAVVGAQAAAGLVAVHAAGVVHKYLAPGNMQIARCADGAERVRILGFDQAVFDTDPEGLNDYLDGTPDEDYAAPELRANPRGATTRTDLYALGALLYVCLTGHSPRGGDVADELPRDAPPALRDAIRSCLAGTPDERPPDASALASALADVALSIAPGRNASLPPAARASRRPTAPPPLAAEPPPGDASRRKEPRASYATPVSLSLGGRTIDGRSEDISQHGMLAVLRETLAVGTECAVRFALPIEGRIVTCPAIVRWARTASMVTSDGSPPSSGSAAACAVGLELVDPAPPTCASIDRYITLMGG